MIMLKLVLSAMFCLHAGRLKKPDNDDDVKVVT